ncbi:hypothetical protein LX32DRAFT_406332 [Colletotrichum zoysiae]|uniref:Uncharacterized protein n=1 Tax=Colletotrichum zoysiae TaxID=1216348 RepID=A0AAD9M185_9PEZI|nr:hypothetical protein LX32DRAFT_406332 [Colletotrichum zoysiae]
MDVRDTRQSSDCEDSDSDTSSSSVLNNWEEPADDIRTDVECLIDLDPLIKAPFVDHRESKAPQKNPEKLVAQSPHLPYTDHLYPAKLDLEESADDIRSHFESLFDLDPLLKAPFVDHRESKAPQKNPEELETRSPHLLYTDPLRPANSDHFLNAPHAWNAVSAPIMCDISTYDSGIGSSETTSSGSSNCEICHLCGQTINSKRMKRHVEDVHRQEGSQLYICKCGHESPPMRKWNHTRHVEKCKKDNAQQGFTCRCGNIQNDLPLHLDHIKDCGKRVAGRNPRK